MWGVVAVERGRHRVCWVVYMLGVAGVGCWGGGRRAKGGISGDNTS